MQVWIWSVLKRILFCFDAEGIHRLTLSFIRASIRLGGFPLRLMSRGIRGGRVTIAEKSPQKQDSSMDQVWGMTFKSRLGLAAGFDKDAEILTGLPELGFGFAEIGTVTPRPQPGNDRPRLFRDPERKAIFNRMGFNGLGASFVAEQVASAKSKLPQGFRVGVNIGKNKDTPNDAAALDYVRAIEPFRNIADYVVINVSSPNTPGLRSLQTVQALQPIVGQVNDQISSWNHRPPLLLKLAPELQGSELKDLIQTAEGWGVNGWVLTNTLAGEYQNMTGGWSGAPLTDLSRKCLIEARQFTRLPIVSVGGVMTPEEAVLRLQSGADLVQIYSGWIFGGPSFPVRVAQAIVAARLEEKR
ncbi:quinone-dependent dihydroorotate dehydrogenase [Bdellovibrionota bacterium FG-1]